MKAREYQILIRHHKKEIETLKLLRLSIDNKQFTSNPAAYDPDNKITTTTTTRNRNYSYIIIIKCIFNDKGEREEL